jgi:HEAT repeat protein
MEDEEFASLRHKLNWLVWYGSWAERKPVLIAIINSNHPRTAKVLASHFTYEETRTGRKIIASTLLKMGREGAEALALAFDNNHVWDEPDVRKRLQELMLQFGELAVEPLIDMLQDRDWRMRDEAAELLGPLGDPRAIQPLLKTLTNPTSNIQIPSARSLAQLKAVEAIEPLRDLLTDESEYMRKAAQEALEALQTSSSC